MSGPCTKETPFKILVVVKHHDGFVLIRQLHRLFGQEQSLRHGEGLALEVSQAATEFDMDMGVYLMPDAHSPLYHVD